MNVILDCNIWISFLLGKRLSSVALIFRNPNIHVYVSKELLQEIRDVISRPKIQKHITPYAVAAMWDLINEHCLAIEDYPNADITIRDAKDISILSMAEAIPADTIVTGAKDLLDLKQYKQIVILTYQQFLLFTSEAKGEA